MSIGWAGLGLQGVNMAKRRTFTAAFRALVTREASLGDKTVQQFAGKHAVHRISQWKRETGELVELFERGSRVERDERKAEICTLHENNGQLVVSRDFVMSAWHGSIGPRVGG